MRWLGLLLVLLLGSARADEPVSICYGYGCAHQVTAIFAEGQLVPLLARLDEARDGEVEKAALADAIGQLYGWAGQQTPIRGDKGGNYADEGRRGAMDCIDHATTTTRLLKLLEARGGLHFHRVTEPVRRTRWMIFEHYSAAIVALDGEARQYAVDSWFVDNGQPAVILPLEEWMDGGGPDV
ncbi:hypothetical protein [Denitratisoma oestradiolicum]|uniref:Uncharacterized protein n=1 Tax=Denitratisoma oestradiolicum TaxID=311182 RepID=A0A6S6Y411_9PROT|nr:hypothetical protein [Denitratisoma oestradiolicum]TWO80114.1 hypothetical protein CBW56_11115 [Denitratisoma oestradiolicum]CAB1370050.1 conserved exported protein of unknown function [Denitratisoma oestradiolicum]